MKEGLRPYLVLVVLSTILMAATAVGFEPALAGKSLETLVMPGPLSEAHKKYENDCSSCHTNFDQSEQKDLCLTCHKKVRSDIERGAGFHGLSAGVKTSDCRSCHTEHKGRDGDIVHFEADLFDHRLTDFPLDGAHASLACASCHEPGKAHRDTPAECNACHKASDPHEGKLGTRCESCHETSVWRVSSFDHSKTDFHLLGKHQTVACSQCHGAAKSFQAPKACSDCHGVDDPHGGSLGNKCESCHIADGWKDVAFDHDKSTHFNLTGKHAQVPCASCHGADVHKKLETTCVSCHRADDVHSNTLGPKCEACHSTQSWTAKSFNHDKDTQFALKGAHRKATCVSCHKPGTSPKAAPRECSGCHKVDDVHKASMGKDCAACHGQSSFASNVRFDHDLSAFPLIGMHAAAPCEACHATQAFKETPSRCRECHATDDVHKGSYGADCAMCHTPNGWGFWDFDHQTQTDFALHGKHKDLSCASCHAPGIHPGRLTGAPCATCHAKDDRHHGRFGRRCEQCHTDESFKDVRIER